MKTNRLFQYTTRMTSALVVTVLLALSGCDSVSTDPGSLEAENQANTKRATSNTVYTFSDYTPVGSSTLRRTTNAVAAEYTTSQLKENDAYSLWWVVFDAPEYCSAPGCSVDDVMTAISGGPNPMEVSMIGAVDGSVAGPDGRAYYKGTLKQYATDQVAFGDGLDNPMTAEIHYVLRTHGPAIPGLINQQISTADGGCRPGQPNVGMCVDVQFSVHVSPFAN